MAFYDTIGRRDRVDFPVLMEGSTEDEANGGVAPRVFAAGLVTFPVERRGKGDGRLSIERLTGV